MVWLRLLFVPTCCLMMASCNATSLDAPARTALRDGELPSDLRARAPRDGGGESGRGAAPADTRTGRSWLFGPEEPVATAAAGVRDVADAGLTDGEEGEGYRLNFDRAEIRDVVHAVLGTMLGLNYTLAADVSGQITIASTRPLARAELLGTLETVLGGQGFAMTKTAAGYRIAPSAAGAGAVDFGARGEPGYGVSVVPLRHVSAAVMQRLVAGFIADSDGLRIDASRNAMVVRGSSVRRQEAVRTILAFDADWMQGQTVGLFEIRRARPEAVVAELSQIFDSGEAGASAGVIQFKPITRLRAVLAVSKNPALIRRAETLTRRLDAESEAGAENVFVYRAKYRDAKELARIVTSLFGAGGDGGRGSGARPGQERGGAREPSPGGGGPGAPGGLGGPGGQGGPGGLGLSASAPNGGASLASAPAGGDFSARFAAAFGDKPPPGGGGASEIVDLTRPEGRNAPKITISADASNNSVIAYADGETYRKIHAALRQLDNAPLQVAVNVTIAEVQLNDDLRFGIQYFVGSDRIGLNKDKGSFSLINQTANIAADAIQKQIPGFNFLVGSSAAPDVIISALDSITDVKVLSSPSLVVLENQTATLQVGDSIPITTRQGQSVENPNAPLINQVEFRDTGIILNVIPRIGQNDAVTMQIEQEISSVTSAANTLTPTISKRKVASVISVVSGQTVLLAGLISERQGKGRSGIPVLGRLPGIGDLFSTTETGAGRTELVVFIRPVVIRNGEDAQSVAEEFRSRVLTTRARQAPVSKY